MKNRILILSAALLAGCGQVFGQEGKMLPNKSPDVYVAGYELDAQNELAATLWKNGVAQRLTGGIKINDENDYAVSVSANDVFVSGGNVYVAGFENDVARLWKNGAVQHLNVDESRHSTANSVYVSGDDVYVTGTKTWKNGEVLYKIEKEPDDPGKLRLNLNGQNIFDWFMQKYQELKRATNYYKRPSIKPEEGKSKGYKL